MHKQPLPRLALFCCYPLALTLLFLYAQDVVAYDHNIFMGVEANFTTCFKLTGESFRELRRVKVDGIPISNVILDFLEEQFEKQLFCSKKEFLNVVVNPIAAPYKEQILEYASYPVEQKYGFDEYSYKELSDFYWQYWPQPVLSLACGRQDTEDDTIMLHIALEEGVSSMISVDEIFSEIWFDTQPDEVDLTTTIDRRSTEAGRELTLQAKNACLDGTPREDPGFLVSTRALIPDEAGEPSVIGKIKVVPYKKKEFNVMIRKVLLPSQKTQNLNLNLVNEREIEDYLNKVYKQAAIEWNVDYTRVDDEVNYDLYQVDQRLESPDFIEEHVEWEFIKDMALQGINQSDFDAFVFLY